ncbi:hypothetical protein ACFL6I_17465 [candidate division KSB1 bacterium]
MTTSNDRVFPDALDGFFFGKAWSIIWDNRDFIVKLVLVTSVVTLLINEVLNIAFASQLQTVPAEPEMFEFKDVVSSLVIMFITMFILFIPMTFFMIVFVKTLPRFFENESVSFSEMLTVRVSTWYLLYIYTVFVLFITIIGFIFCIVPGLIAAIHFAFLPFIIVLEENVSIIPRNFQLISGYRFKVLMVYLLFLIIAIGGILVSSIFLLQNGDSFGAESQEYTFTVFGFLGHFLEQIVTAFINYAFHILLFQLYMMSRIEKGEIEILHD